MLTSPLTLRQGDVVRVHGFHGVIYIGRIALLWRDAPEHVLFERPQSRHAQGVPGVPSSFDGPSLDPQRNRSSVPASAAGESARTSLSRGVINMRLVPANRPLDDVHALVMQGHQVLRITPDKKGKQAFLWDGDLTRLRMTMRLSGIPGAEIFGDGPWRVKVWGRVLDRLQDSVERSKPMGATA